MSPEKLELIDELIRKWGRFYAIEHELDLPDVLINDEHIDEQADEVWIAKTYWNPKIGTAVIEIREHATHDETSLERIVAHEMIHVANFLEMSPAARARLSRGHGRLSDDHGEDFWRLARRANRFMGAGFVTERSDDDLEDGTSG